MNIEVKNAGVRVSPGAGGVNVNTGPVVVPPRPSDVFWATYGNQYNPSTTSGDEIGEAHAAGKVVLCEYRGITYQLFTVDDETYYFGTPTDQPNIAKYLTVSGRTWRNWESSLELRASDVGAIAAPEDPEDGQFLVFDSDTGWTAKTVPEAAGVSF